MNVDSMNYLNTLYKQETYNQSLPNTPRGEVQDFQSQQIKPLTEVSQQQTLKDISEIPTAPEIKDYFEASSMLKKSLEIREDVLGAFNSKQSFDNLADTLKMSGLIDYAELSAMRYLRDNSQKLSFDEFEKIASNDVQNLQLKGLLSSVVHKLHYIDAINGGIMA
ncbi:hypothetical protein [Helicobacter himalayensis]|uniref:hypothetical protein n=1 Tax=Helicobacter himalayensis TaxID=1591088 RepID=UPI000836561A|nr:hypothetical protein [Helicobacter himalayensis]